MLDGAGDVRGNFNELVLGGNRMPRHVTGSVSLCGWEQTGCGVDVIDWDETPFERSFQSKLAQARQGVIALRSQCVAETADNVLSTKIRQQFANIDKVEDIINGQIKKAAVMRKQMQQTKARLKQRQDQMQEGQNGSGPDSAEETRQEYKTVEEMEWHLDKMEEKMFADKRRLDEMRFEEQVFRIFENSCESTANVEAMEEFGPTEKGNIEKGKHHQKET